MTATTTPDPEPRDSYRRLNLGCGEDYREGWTNVDKHAAVDPDVEHDLDDRPWPFPDDEFQHVLFHHVIEHVDDPVATLRETVRVAAPGALVVTVTPLGADAVADPDHTHQWLWQTPEILVSDHWHGVDNLALTQRTVDVWVHWPVDSGWKHRYRGWINEYLNTHGPGVWCFRLPSTSGEMTTVFEVAK